MRGTGLTDMHAIDRAAFTLKIMRATALNTTENKWDPFLSRSLPISHSTSVACRLMIKVTIVSESRSKLGAVETLHTWTGTSASNVC